MCVMKRIIIRNSRRSNLWIGSCCAIAYAVSFSIFFNGMFRFGTIVAITAVGLWIVGHVAGIWYDDSRFSFRGTLFAAGRLGLIAALFFVFSTSLSSGYLHPIQYGILIAYYTVLGSAAAYIVFLIIFTPVFLLFRWVRSYANAEECANCGYCLFGLPENRCPECSLAFDPGVSTHHTA